MKKTELLNAAKELGRKGGNKTFEKYGSDHYKKIRAIKRKKK